MSSKKRIVIVGGGAAGVFAALAAKDENPESSVILLEKSGVLLSKVKVSGGGRCNVTHSCFDPIQLVKNYPRGNKELIGPFTRFQPSDTIQWFESRGVDVKTEADGRMFPTTDNSDTIIECLLLEAGRLGVEIRLKQRIEEISKVDNFFSVTLSTGAVLDCDKLILATGSAPQGHLLAQKFGHSIQPPVPSLFTFNVPSFALADLSGISVDPIKITIEGSSYSQSGPLLITHWGFSGPAALKLSAWAARLLNEKDYKVILSVDWLPKQKREQIIDCLQGLRLKFPNQIIATNNLYNLPKNLWKQFLMLVSIDEKKRLAELSNEECARLADFLKNNTYSVDGKTTHKEEFVTCGGVTLSEVNFKTMESRICPGLYFAGEVLDVDAVTGGFNFQNAWTTGWIAGHAAAE